MSDGPMIGRFRVSTFVLSEARDAVYDGSRRRAWTRRHDGRRLGMPVLVGGGNWLYLTPGVAVMVGKGFNVQADVRLPVWRDLANRQLDSHAIWQLGLSRSF
jgi:hypothetical protein